MKEVAAKKQKKISLSAFDSYDCFITISQEGLIMKDTRKLYRFLCYIS